MTDGEIKRRLAEAEEVVGERPTRFMVVSRPPTAEQLAHRDALEAEGYSVTFVPDPYSRTPREPSP